MSGQGGDRSGLGRSSSRGRAVRNVSPPCVSRPPGSGVVTGIIQESGSPTSTATNLDDLTIQEDNGNGNGDNGENNGNGNGNGNGSPNSGRFNGNGRINGRGNGNGRGDSSVGLRGEGQRRERTLQEYDIVKSKPEGMGKKGSAGNAINLVANYFDVRRTEDWTLYHYRVDFSPEEDYVKVKKGLLRAHSERLGEYMFDGHSLYTSHALAGEKEVIELRSPRTKDNVIVQITIKFVGLVNPETPMYIQFYNIVVRKCQERLNLTLMGRYYYDYQNAVKFTERRLDLWPGFITVLRQHERNLLLCVEITHKVIRQDNVLNIMEQKREEIRDRGGNLQDGIRNELIGTVVMTRYNRKTYRVDDVLFSETPSSVFPYKDGVISYVEYYKMKYNVEIQKARQFILVSNPKKSDVRRGQVGPAKLIPELCQMTGLSEGMRKDFRLMKDLGEHLFQPPQKKVESIKRFVSRIRNSEEINAEMKGWGLEVLGQPLQVQGRILPKELMIFGNDGQGPKRVEVDDKADFTMAFRSSKMAISVKLNSWVVIVPQRDAQHVENLMKTMQTVSRPIGFELKRPLDIIPLTSNNPDTYSQGVTKAMDKRGENMQMIFVILPNNRIETYSAVKKRCNVDYGIPSQCFLAKNMMNPKGLMSIATKVVIQMNAKLGGEPWNVQIPLKNMMIVGFDVHHGGTSSRGASVAAMVCTTSSSYGRYYSTVSFHENRDEVSTKIAGAFSKCLSAYAKVNKCLPDRIIFYRDGVGEGQLHMVYTVELEALKKRLRDIYGEAKMENEAKLTYIVVTKRINTKLFYQTRNGFDNPVPGTVVDDTITWPERWDFYLIAQNVRQGTVSPTSYNVLYERNGLDADKVQRLTYKLCHAYYNWSGTVAVPAPCQYAHKLAYLTGMTTKCDSHQNLSHLLYFL